MKKIYIIPFLLALLLSFPLTPSTFASTQTEDGWIDYGTYKDIDLNKVWTVNFSSALSLSKIDAISVSTGNTFVPVTVTKTAQKQLKISPTIGYTGKTTYDVKIYLKNGLKYKLTFTTKDAARNADKEPNNETVTANSLHLNDNVYGVTNSNNSDYYDYYKVTIPETGKYTVNAKSKDGKSFYLGLYGENSSSYIKQTDGYAPVLSAGLQAGTYYVRIYNGYNGENNYELQTTFEASTTEDDNASSNYVTANELKLNTSVTGHLGYTNTSNNDNENDYYKIIVPEDGALTINATRTNGGELDLYLYGARGNDTSYFSYSTNNTTGTINYGLAAGTYFIRVADSGYYGDYSLNTTFTPATTKNDNAASSYILADEIGLNSTNIGHIGYTYDTGKDNEDDYYKLVVKEQGKVTISAKHLNGKKLSLYLYGEYGTDRSNLNYDTNSTQASISYSVTPGTYYVRIYNANYDGSYELSTTFTAQ